MLRAENLGPRLVVALRCAAHSVHPSRLLLYLIDRGGPLVAVNAPLGRAILLSTIT